MRPRLIATLAAAAALVTIAVPTVVAADSGGSHGTVYTLTNAASGNAVEAFSRAADGSLSWLGTYATGGVGTGTGLGSQGAVALTADGRSLVAVNAGSDDLSTFAVHADGSLALVDREPAGGTMPVSVTTEGDLVYALDAGGSGNIAGFRLAGGTLAPIAGSVQPLSAGATGPAEVAFSPDGSALVVTEKATSRIDTYVVGPGGVAAAPQTFASAGSTPFGFAFDRKGDIFVSEAPASAVSSYAISAAGDLALLSASVPDGGLAACWVVTSPNGRYAYAINAHGGTISSYAIAHDGSITLAQGIAGVTGAGTAPIDAAMTSNGRDLYVVDSGSGAISAFAVGPNGTLLALPGVNGLPASAVGLAAS